MFLNLFTRGGPLVARALTGRAALAGGAGFGAGGLFGGGRRGSRRRRRRARLSQREMMELTWIANTLGKTAASQAMPFYLGRGS